MLTFLAGLIVGGAATALYTKRDEVKKALTSPEFKAQVKRGKKAVAKAYEDAQSEAKRLAPKAKRALNELKEGASELKERISKGRGTKSATKTPAKRGRAAAKATTSGTSATKTPAKRGRTAATKTATATKAPAKRGRAAAATTPSATNTGRGRGRRKATAANLGATKANLANETTATPTNSGFNPNTGAN